jgi:subtilisin family serine protease/uncharacterized membrane protein
MAAPLSTPASFAATAASGAPVPAYSALWMKAGVFDPSHEPPPLPPALTQSTGGAMSAPARDGMVRFILQFGGGVSPALLEALRGQGIAFERYLPDGGMIAAAPPGRFPRSAEAVGARAILPLHPGFRMDPDLWPMAIDPRPASVRVVAEVFDSELGADALRPFGNLVAFDGRVAILDTDARALRAIATLGDVEWVERYVAPHTLNNYLTRTIGARQQTDGPFAGTANAVWSYDNATDAFPGLNGSGIVINIADTGIDASHPAFDGRIVAAYGYGFNATCDCSGFPHGTHVAGIAAGNGSWRPEDANQTDGYYAGVAPEAGLVAQLIFGVPRTTAQLSQDAVAAGAFVNSNSWGLGPGGAYTSSSESYDQLVLDANGREAGEPQMVYVFAAGNSGPGAYTVEAPGTAKNVITVGATGNTRYSSADQVAGFSSRGPTADGRLKPDLLAPGDGVMSAKGDPADNGCVGEGGCSYWTASGTSMSTPAVSGAAALVAQYYNIHYANLPSAALVKAVLINGATPLPGYAYPSFEQGWGRVNVARSLNQGPSFEHVWRDEGVALAQVAGRDVANFSLFAESGEELRIVLVWSDVPASPGAAKTLINDLDLEVRAPDGTLYRGNDLASGYSAPSTRRDSTNNTEVVRIQAPDRGLWNVTVRAASIPSGEQKFAVAASGNLRSNWVSVAPKSVDFEPTAPREDDPLVVLVPVVNTGTVYSPGFNVSGTLEGPEGTTTITTFLFGVRPNDDLPAVFSFTPKRGPHTFRVDIDPDGRSHDVFPADNQLEAAVFVRGFDVALAAFKNSSALPPLGSDTVLFQVTNRGNVIDSVQVSAEASLGWTLVLNASLRALQPGESAFVAGTVTAPDQALVGEFGTLNITAVSLGNPSRASSIEEFVAVAAAPSSQIVQESFAASADPGGRVTFGYTIENTGNVPLHFDIGLSPGSAIDAGWLVDVGPPSMDLPPYSRANRTVSVAVPPTATAFKVEAFKVSVDGAGAASSAELPFQVTVNRTGGVSVVAASTSKAGDPGDTLDFPIRVQNGGNAKESFTVAVNSLPGGSSGVGFDVDNGTLVVPPFGEAYVTVTASIGRYAAAGDAVARLFLVAPGSQTFQVNLTTNVRPVHGIDPELPPRIFVVQGSAAVAVVTLTNDGNVDEPVVLEILSSPEGLTLDGWGGGLLVPKGGSRTVQLRLAAAESSTPGAAELRLAVKPADGHSFTAMALTIPVEVRPAERPTTFLPGVGTLGLAAALAIAAVGTQCRKRR